MKVILFTTNEDKSMNMLHDYISFLNAKHKDKKADYTITLKKYKHTRTISQNRLYWAILTAIAVHTGSSKEELHQWYGLEFLGYKFAGKMIAKSTTELDKEEFKIYVNKVKEHAETFHGCSIASENDRHFEMWDATNNNRYDNLFNR